MKAPVLLTHAFAISFLFLGCQAKKTFVSKRAAQFEALVHDDTSACKPAGESSQWSCIRRVSDEELKGFVDQSGALCKRGPDRGDGVCDYGFANAKEAKPSYKIHDIEDNMFTWQIPRVPRVSKGPGFLKMNMTSELRDLVFNYWETNRNTSWVVAEKAIPGGFLNNHAVSTSLLSLDRFIKTRTDIGREVRAVLEWWTERELKIEAVYGVRVYHRGSMLLNHVDSHATHVASAVLQVDQEVDRDGGWPLEVVAETGDVYQVYLQPGEMVLYEGAKLKHGRPMRFRGEMFANIFAHMRPHGWKGARRVEL
eukprot:TRINITY_DN57667_c0_g1_i1.p1 TRINITY_DN57667_c0_g1~~TRINITY_DN57667_c0_g1_i1.p1  ORF type:complete len:310 (+),score=39.93 TRINITY_DN57667_c0_g1_i1:77-1006(+)